MFKISDFTKEYFIMNDCKYEHQFKLSDDITITEFQEILNNCENVINNLINKIGN